MIALDQTACPICAARNLEIFRDDEDKKLSSAAIGSSRRDLSPGRILRCRNCGFGFRCSRPSEKELASLYRDLDSEIYEQESFGRLMTARRHFKIVRRYVTSGTLLDVGCASGMFIHCAADAGWNVVGIEPAEVLCNKAQQLLRDRGLVMCTTLQDASLAISSFDVITLWDVLEHVPDPIGFLRICSSLLKTGGYLFVNVPNLDSLQARFLGRRWPLLLAEHLNYFNQNSLKMCAEHAQLQWVHFGQRPASFSLAYVLYRLSQHQIPTTTFLRRIFPARALSAVRLPVFLGELYGVWRA